MTPKQLVAAVHEAVRDPLPLPAGGQTALRHRRLVQIARKDLSLARLVEAHCDALAILAEAGRTPQEGALYGVWASERPGAAVVLTEQGGRLTVGGTKMFCSGAGLLDRALVTVTSPQNQLIDVDLRTQEDTIRYDSSDWKTAAFAETQTGSVTWQDTPIKDDDLVCGPGWYLERPGFWHGALGPAACWAGGAIGLVDYARAQRRSDGHTLAHLGALQASAWALEAYLDVAGAEVDKWPNEAPAARIRARTVRHLVEAASTDILQHLGRAYGPHPLAFDENVSKRYAELQLYLRQWHAERDLEALGKDVQTTSAAGPSPGCHH